ncbi:asl1098 [Nostoc sp. PCC 7120 = FACHB-418]|nr:asl1098 [Nostoc sp. PCC 7120 = FACHB-418]
MRAATILAKSHKSFCPYQPPQNLAQRSPVASMFRVPVFVNDRLTFKTVATNTYIQT